MSFRNIFSRNKVYRTKSSVYLFFAWFLVLAALSPADSAFVGSDEYLDSLLKTAKEKHLSEDRYWNILLHYKQKGSGRTSLIDDPKFFLAADGKTNPQSELEAALISFSRQRQEGAEPARCRFPVRYGWLKERLSIDDSKMPAVQCAKLDEALALISPKSATLIFPAAHGNGPASMFGHTLIRIDGNSRSDLLSYAVNYAAVTTDRNGFVYAFKGIFGFYKGYFSILPYYEKVGEYNDIEHRDIWEYELNLSEQEVRRMLMHIWELKDIYSDYYFFDENCSYDLLFLLEAARPSARLTDRFDGRLRFWVIPSDTVRVIMESGLVENVKYRPSQATRIRAMASRMETAHQDVALDVTYGKTAPGDVVEIHLAPEEKMQILDLTAELIQYRFARKAIGKDEFQRRFLAALKARSALGTQTELPPITPPLPPEKGHLPGKFGVSPGYRNDSAFTELSWRAAYHDLMDPDEGYVEGAQINFFDIRGRYYFKERDVLLQNFRFIDIVSLAARDKFFKPVSWKVNTGFDRELLAGGKERLIYRVNPGGGVAYESRLLGLSYVLLETDLNLSSEWKNAYALGIGPSAGIFKTVAPGWKISLTAGRFYYLLGEEHRSTKVSFAQNIRVAANHSIQFSLSREEAFHQYRTEAKLGWHLYF